MRCCLLNKKLFIIRHPWLNPYSQSWTLRWYNSRAGTIIFNCFNVYLFFKFNDLFEWKNKVHKNFHLSTSVASFEHIVITLNPYTAVVLFVVKILLPPITFDAQPSQSAIKDKGFNDQPRHPFNTNPPYSRILNSLYVFVCHCFITR